MPLIIPALLFSEALVGRRLLAPNDGFQGYLPLYSLAGRLWRAGQLPAWDPFLFSGYPLLAAAQAAVFYPPILLFVALPDVPAMNTFVVFHVLLAGTGAWILARRLCGDPLGAVVAGVTFGLCGFMLGHLGHTGLIATTAWMPWSLYAFERLRERLSPLRLLLASGSLTLSLLAGHFQAFFVTILVLGLYAGGLGLRRAEGSWWRPPLLCALMAVVALGLGAIQVLPTARYVTVTDRSEFSYTDAMSFSMPKSHSPLLLFPFLFGNGLPSGPFDGAYSGQWNLNEMAAYPGAAALVLAAAGLGALRRDRRMPVLVGVAVLTGVLAFGPATPLSRLVYRLPVYGQFRSWARFLVVSDLVVALLAAYGVQALRTRSPVERRAACGRAAAMAGAVVLAGVTLPHLDAVHRFLPQGQVDVAAVAFPAGAALAGAVVALAFARWQRAPGLLVAVVALDLTFSFGAFSEWRTGSPSPNDLGRDTGRTVWGGVADKAGGIDRYLFIGGNISGLRAGPTHFDYVYVTDHKGLRSANGQNPLAPADYLEVWGMSPFGLITAPERIWRPASRLLDLLRVTTVLVDTTSVTLPPEPAFGEGFAVGERKLLRYEYSPRLPDAFLVGAVERRSRSEIIARLDGRAPFDPSQLTLVEEDCHRCPGGAPGSAGKAVVVSWRTQTVRVDVVATRPAMLVLSQAWLPGWSASIDDHRVPVLRVDGAVQGIPIAAGRHRVVVTYEPPGLRLGLALT